jgi:hypothetical protein
MCFLSATYEGKANDKNLADLEGYTLVLRNYWISIPYACWPADKAHNAGCETALDERLPSRDNSQGQEPFSQRTPWRCHNSRTGAVPSCRSQVCC